MAILATSFMNNFLQFGVLCLLLSIVAEAALSYFLWQRSNLPSFTLYSTFVAFSGIVLFTLLSQGNGGLYLVGYWISEYIQDVLIAAVTVELLWKWRKWSRFEKHVAAGLVIAVVFPNMLHFRNFVPASVMYVPVYSFMVAQAVWCRGLRREPSK
jgi:hypothetical protein